MALPPSGIVTVRLAPRDADDIDALVRQGLFTSRSDFLRHAVRATVAAFQAKAASAPPAAASTAADAEDEHLLEGPGALGASEANARGRPARSAPKRGIHG